MRSVAFAACLVILATSGHAEMVRCVEPSGRGRFTDDPSVCAEAVAVEPLRDLIRTPSAALNPAAPGEERVEERRGAPDLERLFPPVEDAWEIVREAPENPDPVLRSQGLRASLARHYTRARGPVSEVCTVEIWAFEDADQAVAVATSLAQPGWEILQADAILVLVHGVRLERRVGTRRELVDGCAELGERTRTAAGS
jgi:hypothetical protein